MLLTAVAPDWSKVYRDPVKPPQAPRRDCNHAIWENLET